MDAWMKEKEKRMDGRNPDRKKEREKTKTMNTDNKDRK